MWSFALPTLSLFFGPGGRSGRKALPRENLTLRPPSIGTLIPSNEFGVNRSREPRCVDFKDLRGLLRWSTFGGVYGPRLAPGRAYTVSEEESVERLSVVAAA